jgi:hypothetical protein
MTNLSPATQAVLDAYEQSSEAYYEERGQLAAALRAAANPFHWTWNAEMCHKHLHAIADELEGSGTLQELSQESL